MIRKCTACGQYTLHQDACPRCGGQLRNPHPAKFSPDDRYSRFRLALKLEEKEKEDEMEEEEEE
jgi:H/ACA ribonucleoprotein complex subunit 3